MGPSARAFPLSVGGAAPSYPVRLPPAALISTMVPVLVRDQSVAPDWDWLTRLSRNHCLCLILCVERRATIQLRGQPASCCGSCWPLDGCDIPQRGKRIPLAHLWRGHTKHSEICGCHATASALSFCTCAVASSWQACRRNGGISCEGATSNC